MRDGTRVIHAGLPVPSQGAAFLPGPTFAGAYHAAGDPASAPFTYGRFHNPTWEQYERALSELEGGPAVIFSSGMATVTAIFSAVLRPGDVLVLPADSYYTIRVVADGYFSEMGIRVKKAPTAGNAQLQQLAGAKFLWLESPSNPGLDVCDIAASVTAAHEAGALVAVDNTTATVLGQRPLALGADFSVASDTKALTGHADLILGHVAAREQAWADRLRTWRTQTGAVPGPMEVWLAHRSLATLELRLERQCQNALAIAQFLTTRPEVQQVRYPGLPDDPAHAVAARQMQRFGSVVNFTLADRHSAERFLSASRLLYEATSFGGLYTTAERRARWGGDAIPEGFIRFNAGCENIEDLLADIAQALERIAE
ncbi:MAG: cystathionine gamma-lyase [Deltaproteobacteria bacterium]|nr:cystathionine gamma-lyase [Deltaproteobacteria bacterium]